MEIRDGNVSILVGQRAQIVGGVATAHSRMGG